MLLGNWPYLLVPLASRPGAASLVVLTVAFFGSGLGIGVTVVVVLLHTLRQTVTPNGRWDG